MSSMTHTSQAAAIEPMNADLYFNLGRVLATGGNDRKTAGYFYNIAKNLDPYHASAWNRLSAFTWPEMWR
eukprot:748008-Hanusia_phi.AAC.4